MVVLPQSLRTRRVRARGLGVALLTTALFLVTTGTAAADRAFTTRFSANDTGQITAVGNALMTCPAAASGCTGARAAGPSTTANDALDNNAYDMGYVDVDTDPTTFDSSQATLALPAGAQVLFAGLYWGGDYSTGSAAAPNAGARGTVAFKAPGAGAYSALTASTLDDSALNPGRYQGFADVTSRVAAAGNGQYAVANVQAGTGADHYAGWSLVVVYRDTTQPVRNLTVFDGLATIRSGDAPTDIPVSGFLTPPTGAVKTELGFVTYEGDNGIVGDSASLNGTVLSDAQHPASNFFDSRISTNGVDFTAKNPNYPSQLAFDIAYTNANGILPNNATSATIRVTTSGDQYLPGVITFATDIFAPTITQTKAVSDDNGSPVQEGHTLTYTITATNSGQDGASGFVLRDPIPANVDYVPGSLKVNPTAATAPVTVTDAAGDDLGEYVAASNQIVARLGTGATATAGGNVKAGASYVVTFKVKVHGPATSPVPPGTTINNTATASYLTQTTGLALTSSSAATSTITAPDLRLIKTRTGPAPVAGSTTQYTLAVDNVGTAPTQGTVTVDDVLPAGLTQTAISAPGWTCATSTPARVTCTRGDALAAGASYPSIVVSVKIASNVTGSLANTATVSGGGDGALDNNSSTDTSPSTSSADLSLTKVASKATINIGDQVTFTLVATNNGPSDATSVVISDPLPGGLSYVSSTPACVVRPTSGVLDCTIGALAAGASSTVSIIAKAKTSAGATTQTNTAAVGGAQTDPNPANDSASSLVAVSGADLAVTKTSSTPEPVRDGNTVVYAVAVANNGGSAATGVVLSDLLPASLINVTTNKPAACTVTTGANPTVTCAVGALAAGASFGVTITGTASKPSSTLVNRASGVGNEPDPNLDNNSASVSKNTAPTADLSIAKSASASSAKTGDTLIYTLAVTDQGPDSATNAVASDVLPTGLTFVGAAAGCTYAPATRTVSCALGTIANGATVSRTITTTVNTAAPQGTLVNTATTSSDVFDGNPSNDQAQVPTVIAKSADLSLVKTASPGSGSTGDALVYSLKVVDIGPDDAAAVSVSDVLPGGVSFVSASPGCVYDGPSRTVTCAVGALASGASVSLTVSTVINGSAGASILNSATVQATTPDPSSANNTGSVTTAVVKRADVAISKTASAGPVAGGDSITYTLVASNAGPDIGHGVVVSDVLPAGVTFVMAPGCGFVSATRTVTCSGFDLAPGAQSTFSVVVTVAADAPASLVNTASVSATELDPNSANNSASATTQTVRKADLALTKAAPAGPLGAGDALRYTLTATNSGPDSAAAVSITDVLPAGVTYTTSSAGCAYDAPSRTVTCAVGTLAPGAASTVTIDTKVAANAPASIANTARASSTTPDPTPGNNTATATTTTVKRADLALTKTAPAGPLSTGDAVAYGLKVTNGGPDDAAAVSVSDVLPGGATFVSAPAACGYDSPSRKVTCAAASLASGASITFTIQARVSADAPASILNTASVSSSTPDPTSADNTASASTAVVKAADVAMAKVAQPGPVGAGDALAYTLTASNGGPDTAHGVTVTDVLPAGVTFVSAPGCAYAVATRTVTCAGFDLAVAATKAFTVNTTVAADAPASLVNTASVSATELDPNSANNSASATTQTVRKADVALTKAAPAGPLGAGDALRYTLTATNSGPDSAAAVSITDVLPAGVTYTTSSAVCAYDAPSRTVTCAVGTLAPGAASTVTIDTKVAANAPASIANTARASSTTPDPTPGNNTATATTATTPTPAGGDVAITKTVDNATPQAGQTVTYTLAVVNRGPGGATGVVASDTLPVGVSFLSADPACSHTATTVSCNAGDLASGAGATFHIKATVDPRGVTVDPNATHLITTTKVEQQIDLNPGETKTASVSCAGGLMTDGSFRVDAVDQGTGTLADVHAIENRQIGDSAWQTTLRNDASGRAQAKVFGVCIAVDTHPFIVSVPVTDTQVLPAGRTTVVLPCGPGQTAIAPGFLFQGGDARVVASEDSGTGWSFTVEVPVATTATFSIRCLSTLLGAVGGHTNGLRLTHPSVTANIPAGQTVTVQVICGDTAKGIVATSSLASGLISLGNDPEPKTRVFKVLNPTNADLTATFDLVCLDDTTGGEVNTPAHIDNTATVSASGPDPNPANNASSAGIDVKG